MRETPVKRLFTTLLKQLGSLGYCRCVLACWLACSSLRCSRIRTKERLGAKM